MTTRNQAAVSDPWWFQPRAINECLAHWKSGIRRVCLVSPPGSGKTEMAGAVLKLLKPKRPICIVHTLALNDNASSRLGIETFTVQSLLNGEVNLRGVDFVIWDECHHSGGEVWGTVLEQFSRKVRVLGLTGTPQRSDGKALSAFEVMVVAAHYSELLMSKTLVPFRVLTPKAFRDDADPDPIAAYQRFGENRRTLFFCRSVDQADEVAKALPGVAPWHCEVGWNERAKSFKAFSGGRLRGLATVDALTEGVNVPDADCVVLGQRCLNVGTYLQRVARAGRAAPRKRFALLLDLTGASRRHGPPTIDREYSITGTGIERRASSSGRDYYYERAPREPPEINPYDADLEISYDFQTPSAADKRRQLGWLIQQAGRRGWTKDVAVSAFQTLFGEDPK